MRISFVLPALAVAALATAYGCTLPLQGLSADGSGGAAATSTVSAGGAPTTATGLTTSGPTSTTSTGPAECTADAMCGISDLCVDYACSSGVCKKTVQPEQTKVGDDTPGDCKQTVCVAGTATPAPDLADPSDSGNPCKVDGCTVDGPITTPKGNGTPCGSGQFCLDGDCRECAADGDCTEDTNECTTVACNGGTCVHVNNTDGCENGGAGLCVSGNCCSLSSACLTALKCCDANEMCTFLGCKPKP